MKFKKPLIEGRLIRRYKRFLADIELNNGAVVTAHTANTGAMSGCSEPGSRVWLSHSDNPKRKYPLTWELVEVAPGVPCGINTMQSNKLVREAIASGNISELRGYQNIYSERRYGKENSRIDLLLEAGSSYNTPPCYVEIKNVTLVQEAVAYFPDAVSNRAAKHLRELMGVIDNGGRAVIFFCVQRNDCKEVRPAVHIDKVYAETLKKARQAGVEALAYRFNVSAEEILLDEKLPVIL
ncbi:MAG: DNA/RNA nuclease SfsA [Gammaproteobacteria bacterium]